MKRVAGTMVGLVILIMFLLYGGNIYEYLAYQDGHVLTDLTTVRVHSIHSSDPGIEPIAVSNWFGNAVRPAKKLRWAWFPGPTYVFDKTCIHCLGDSHHICLQDTCIASYLDARKEGDLELSLQDESLLRFTCTCPLRATDPEHP